MNKQELEKRLRGGDFEELLDMDGFYCTENITNFIFSEVIPEVLLSVFPENDGAKKSKREFDIGNVFGQEVCRMRIGQKAKELYGITL